MSGRLTGQHPEMLRYIHDHGSSAVTVGRGAVYIDGVCYPAGMLRFLADLASGTDAHGYPRTHVMSECYWVDCPEHKCEYTMSHTRNWCGRPTCRES